jgi:WD repeat and SOF domain-containing protein 1
VQDQDHGLSTTGESAEEHVFHIFWTGPFTDKPYFTLLSFLFTQDLKLHLHPTQNSPYVPQIWVWIHEPQQTPGSRTDEQLHEQLRTNPWSAPFLHQRFREVVRFRRWDTGEQLDALPELRGWRDLPRLHVTDERMVSKSRMVHDDHDTNGGPYGSRSQEAYDRASVALSDIARFVLCHRFGGVYLDADVILLRDWAELLRSPSAFAYRWSRLDAYNTAVLRLRRGSALGSFILRAARAQRLDLHPMAISRYLREAGLDLLLARLPDALFDPAWLNVREFSTSNKVSADVRDVRPSIFSGTAHLCRTSSRTLPRLPGWKRCSLTWDSFGDFFQPRPWDLPQAVGSVGFFRGAYAYHYHNYWYARSSPTNR